MMAPVGNMTLVKTVFRNPPRLINQRHSVHGSWLGATPPPLTVIFASINNRRSLSGYGLSVSLILSLIL
jgi:hypothetical protein